MPQVSHSQFSPQCVLNNNIIKIILTLNAGRILLIRRYIILYLYLLSNISWILSLILIDNNKHLKYSMSLLYYLKYIIIIIIANTLNLLFDTYCGITYLKFKIKCKLFQIILSACIQWTLHYISMSHITLKHHIYVLISPIDWCFRYTKKYIHICTSLSFIQKQEENSIGSKTQPKSIMCIHKCTCDTS